MIENTTGTTNDILLITDEVAIPIFWIPSAYMLNIDINKVPNIIAWINHSDSIEDWMLSFSLSSSRDNNAEIK